MTVRDRIVTIGRVWYGALRPIRRTTVIGPLIEAHWMRAVLSRIDGDVRQVRVLGPEELSPYLRALTPLSSDREAPQDLTFDAIVVRQDQLTALPPAVIAALHQSYACVYANRRFALFTRAPSQAPSRAAAVVAQRVETLIAVTPAPPAPRTSTPHDCVIVMTTFNRPAALARALPQVANLGYRVIVVDDGTTGAAGRENASICEVSGAARLALPDNRGLAAAMNIGLAYAMADPAVEWISYFQDDVDVAPEVMSGLHAIADRHQRPLVTGYDAHQHATDREVEVAGYTVKLKGSSPAVHLHGHVDYWKSVMPIPSEYVGAPRRRWEASMEDYWIVNNATGALTKRGLLIACLPGLVRTFLYDAGDSTWDNPNRADPPLTPRHS